MFKKVNKNKEIQLGARHIIKLFVQLITHPNYQLVMFTRTILESLQSNSNSVNLSYIVVDLPQITLSFNEHSY